MKNSYQDKDRRWYGTCNFFHVPASLLWAQENCNLKRTWYQRFYCQVASNAVKFASVYVASPLLVLTAIKIFTADKQEGSVWLIVENVWWSRIQFLLRYHFIFVAKMGTFIDERNLPVKISSGEVAQYCMEELSW